MCGKCQRFDTTKQMIQAMDGQIRVLSHLTQAIKEDLQKAEQELKESFFAANSSLDLTKVEELEKIIRTHERRKCWGEIDAHIKTGPLPGDGTDQNAERNGMILACNILRGHPSRSYIR